MRKFNSQICTTREQSERLLSLGLRKETADMVWNIDWCCSEDAETIVALCEHHPYQYFPAWSLGRLIEMLPSPIQHNQDLPSFSKYAFLDLHKASVSYEYEDYDGIDCVLASFYGNGFFNAVVDCIEWLIKEGYFNKEYLI